MRTPVELEADLVSGEFLIDPHTVLAELRALDPVHWSPGWGVWVLTRHGDVVAALRDHMTFSNAGRFHSLLNRLPEDVQPAIGSLRRHYSTGIIQTDPPAHTRLRLLVRDVFTPAAIEHMRPRVIALTDQLIDSFEPSGSVELMGQLAYPLPVTVICGMMGVPNRDHASFLEWDAAISGVQATGAAEADRAIGANLAIEQIESYFTELVAVKRTRPSDDLIGRMLTVDAAGDRPLTDDELMAMCVSFLLGGHETTRNLIGSAVFHLWGDAGLLARLRHEPADIGRAIEEVLRLESPIQRAWRRAAKSVILGGAQIREDDLVYLMIGAANRDPAVFDDAEVFNIDRTEGRHIAFGYGIHFCVGAALARMEAAIAIERLLARVGDWTVDGPVSWVPSVHQRGPAELHLARRR